MKSRKQDKDESIVGRDASAGRTGARPAAEPGSIRDRLERGELVIEFELEDPEDTIH
jgi:hypothetical protein